MRQAELREIIEAARYGDRAALADLYVKFQASMLNLAFRILRDRDEAEDVCQEAWLQVQHGLPGLRSTAAFSAWLRRIVTTAALKRVGRHELTDEAEILNLPAGVRADPAYRLEAREDAALAWDALAALSARQRAALYLREVEGYSYQQIASTIDATVSGVETLLFRARRSLAKTYHRLAQTPASRCRQARTTMAAVLDGEGGRMERMMLRGHALSCRVCRDNLLHLHRGSRVHAAVPLLPVAGALAVKSSSAMAGIFSVPKLGLLLAKAKAQLVPVVFASGIAATSVATVGMSSAWKAPAPAPDSGPEAWLDSPPLSEPRKGLQRASPDQPPPHPSKVVAVPPGIVEGEAKQYLQEASIVIDKTIKAVDLPGESTVEPLEDVIARASGTLPEDPIALIEDVGSKGSVVSAERGSGALPVTSEAAANDSGVSQTLDEPVAEAVVLELESQASSSLPRDD